MQERIDAITRALEELTRAAYQKGYAAAMTSMAADHHGRRTYRTPTERLERLSAQRLHHAKAYYERNKNEINERKRAETFRNRKLDKETRIRNRMLREAVAGQIVGEQDLRYIRGEDNRTAEQVIADWIKEHAGEEHTSTDDTLALIEKLRN